MSKNAIATVFYPEAKDYIVDFLYSVRDQSVRDFVLIILNNGLNNINDYINKIHITYLIDDINATPALARERLINLALGEGFEKVIFADCDDLMSTKRLEVSLKQLNNFDVVVNDLSLFNKNNSVSIDKYLSKRIPNLQNICLDMLYEKNFMGLSNTAVRSEALDMNLKPSNPNLKAYDWFLWSKILLKNKNTIFLEKPLTKYRIHDKNVAHLNKKFSELEIINGIKVKKNHYDEFKNVNDKYDKLIKSFDYIHSKIKDISWMSNYKKLVDDNKLDFPHWWENIIIPSKLRK